MDPLSLSMIAKIIWDNLGQPIIDKVRENYSEKVIEKVQESSRAIGLSDSDSEKLVNELTDADYEIFENQEKFIHFFTTNKNLIELFEKNKDFNIDVKKGIGYIENFNGDVSF